MLPGAWQDYLILEAFATKISAYEPQRIPALLQTPAYARELAEADPGLVGGDARDSAVAAVLARQKAILGERKPDIHADHRGSGAAPGGRRPRGHGRAARPARRDQR